MYQRKKMPKQFNSILFVHKIYEKLGSKIIQPTLIIVCDIIHFNIYWCAIVVLVFQLLAK